MSTKKHSPSGLGSITEKLAADLRATLPELHGKLRVEEVGEIISIGDGVCRISGLPSARVEDVAYIATEDGSQIACLILGITEHDIEAVVIGEYAKIRQGDVVRSTGTVLTVPAGEGLLGRVVNPLGEPLDGRGPIHGDQEMAVEAPAPGVARREPVVEQLETGVTVVDTIIPLGRGQRELIIGDRKSGKTRLMESFIANQKGKDIYCFYVAIGAQKAKIRALEERLRQAGAMEYTTIVMASSDDQPSLNYIAPYAGTAMAEYFVYRGKHAIIIYDDLSKQAKSYRQMSLLLKRSPGRDAYPGDIFYLHSRLLERSARYHKDYGNGSLTGFPMCETQNGDVSDYICTNLMSITDGHIYLDVNLMHDGVMPSVNSGLSVSRVGGTVQPPALRKLGEIASSQLARYNEVKSFEILNTEINDETAREIARGKRIMIAFTQSSSLCLSNAEKTLIMYAVTSGMTDTIDLPQVTLIRDELISYYRANPDLTRSYAEVAESASLNDVTPALKAIITSYVPTSSSEQALQMINQPEA
jgi:F-type H+/Na+-transporting ATPase subunit alpha